MFFICSNIFLYYSNYGISGVNRNLLAELYFGPYLFSIVPSQDKPHIQIIISLIKGSLCRQVAHNLKYRSCQDLQILLEIFFSMVNT